MDEKCNVEPQHRKVSSVEFQKARVAVLAVEGMGCPNCAARVRNSLISLYGVTDAVVNHVTGSAKVSFNPDLVGFPALADAVTRSGIESGHIYYALPASYYW
jgi:copper chaperone CopZ